MQMPSSYNDVSYARAMITHHEAAVAMSKLLLKGNPRPLMKKFAEKVIEAQSKEIEWLKSWLRANA